MAFLLPRLGEFKICWIQDREHIQLSGQAAESAVILPLWAGQTPGRTPGNIPLFMEEPDIGHFYVNLQDLRVKRLEDSELSAHCAKFRMSHVRNFYSRLALAFATGLRFALTRSSRGCRAQQESYIRVTSIPGGVLKIPVPVKQGELSFSALPLAGLSFLPEIQVASDQDLDKEIPAEVKRDLEGWVFSHILNPVMNVADT